MTPGPEKSESVMNTEAIAKPPTNPSLEGSPAGCELETNSDPPWALGLLSLMGRAMLAVKFAWETCSREVRRPQGLRRNAARGAHRLGPPRQQRAAHGRVEKGGRAR